MEPLHPVEVRVLGALLEKEITTPEYYPLTLNALVNACNQKSSREPVVNYDEATVQQALALLRNRGLALKTSGAGHRVEAPRPRGAGGGAYARAESSTLCRAVRMSRAGRSMSTTPRLPIPGLVARSRRGRLLQPCEAL